MSIKATALSMTIVNRLSISTLRVASIIVMVATRKGMPFTSTRKSTAWTLGEISQKFSRTLPLISTSPATGASHYPDFRMAGNRKDMGSVRHS
jgi:hypothetical protein